MVSYIHLLSFQAVVHVLYFMFYIFVYDCPVVHHTPSLVTGVWSALGSCDCPSFLFVPTLTGSVSGPTRDTLSIDPLEHSGSSGTTCSPLATRPLLVVAIITI